MRRYLDIIIATLVALLIGIGVDAGSVVYASASQTNYGTVLAPTAPAAPYQPPTETSAVRPELTRTVMVHGILAGSTRYRIVSGDTLSGISGRTYGSYKYWPAIYAANKSTIKNANLIYPGQTIGIPAKPAHMPQLANSISGDSISGDGDASPPSHSTTPVVPVSSGNLSGTLGCGGLEALWLAAGGRQSSAFIAAEIAMAESGGNQFAHSPTNDFGYWQINGVHGSMATYNPMGNARAAVSISGDGSNWNPWTTYTSGAYQGKCSSLTSATRIGIPRATGSAGTSKEIRALAWAFTQAGKWYSWAGAGPSVYDCSGLVMRAYEHVGIYLPHNTVQMLYSGHLHRTYHPKKGDVIMWGGGSPYHIEFYISASTTYGAHRPGKQIGYAGMWGSPQFYTVS
jgi:LysM repeat protein